MKSKNIVAFCITFILASCQAVPAQVPTETVVPVDTPSPTATITPSPALPAPSATFTPGPTLAVPTGVSQPVTLKKIINHERPGLKLSSLEFSDLEKCDRLEREDLWGGLTPNYPLVSCIRDFTEHTSWDAVLPNECFQIEKRFHRMSCQEYVIAKDGDYQHIRSMDDLRAVFAPVDSPEEALAFALMSNNDYSALYGQVEKFGYVYYVETIEDTHVLSSLPEGYTVNVFYITRFGCGHFDVIAINVKVSIGGQVKEINRYPIYRDPSRDGFCVD
jgi:hypothetical protein